MRSCLALAVLLATPAARADDAAYTAELSQWRADREAELRAEDGWLTVAGLFWLQEGPNRLGSASDNEVILPAGPPHAGVLEHHAGRTILRVEPGVVISRNGAANAAAVTELKADTAGGPDTITLGKLRFHVIERGGKYAVRVRDPDSPRRKTFIGRAWYPIAPRARRSARFVAYAPPRTLEVPNILGQVIPMPSPGRALFRIDGREVGLDAVLESPDAKELFFIFNDETSGKGTYPGGRFLYSELPRDGAVVLDFNKAHSPPCAFTPYATCPLPPRQNRLPVRIEAGERLAGH